MPKIANEMLDRYNLQVALGRTESPYLSTKKGKSTTSGSATPTKKYSNKMAVSMYPPSSSSSTGPRVTTTQAQQPPSPQARKEYPAPEEQMRTRGPLGNEPQCPMCGAFCIMRQNRRDRSIFWGCHQWQHCVGTLPLEMTRVEQQRLAGVHESVAMPTNPEHYYMDTDSLEES
jgi:hypothetical protein